MVYGHREAIQEKSRGQYQTQMDMIESNTFSLDEVVDSLSRNAEVDRDAHQKYESQHRKEFKSGYYH